MNYKLEALIKQILITITIVIGSTDYKIVFAQSIYAQNYNFNCTNTQTQLEINRCADLEYQAVDLKLNQVYQQLRANINNSYEEKQLINAQLAWLKFRDLNCEYAADKYKGGSIQPFIYSSCLTQLTKERVRHLESYLKP